VRGEHLPQPPGGNQKEGGRWFIGSSLARQCTAVKTQRLKHAELRFAGRWEENDLKGHDTEQGQKHARLQPVARNVGKRLKDSYWIELKRLPGTDLK